MNKIYKAFDSIKLDEKIKNRTYQTLKQIKTKKNKNNYLAYGSLSLVLITTFIFFFANAINAPVNEGKDSEITTLSTTEGVNDMILYSGSIYELDEGIDPLNLDIENKIGELNQIISSNNLEDDFDSYYHNGYDIYRCIDDGVLIAKSNSDILVYKKR